MSLVSFPIIPFYVSNALTAYQENMKNRCEERLKLTDANLYERRFDNNRLWTLGLSSRAISVRIIPVIAKSEVENARQSFSNAKHFSDMYALLDFSRTENIKELLDYLLWFAIEKDDCSRVTVKHLVDIVHIMLNTDVTLFEFRSIENAENKW
eukprot:CAMPEP_0185026122 /NCGR_PEP_ID=MMETSP1103-20130426/10034_1 /TAXON_ID=36769 /ORGANISM="Paraphysomonas bandaiensis, Strain Caron Lab Isolate" /LENGTH=152 /DNA_ID=CAMNT_0027559603 /DNA_START=56 /DNA_END=511 /DNA_ORIENTATION=+